MKISETRTVLDDFRVEIKNKSAKFARNGEVDSKGNLKHKLKQHQLLPEKEILSRYVDHGKAA